MDTQDQCSEPNEELSIEAEDNEDGEKPEREMEETTSEPKVESELDIAPGSGTVIEHETGKVAVIKKVKRKTRKNVTTRFSEIEYNNVLQKALVHTEGNIAEWIRFASQNCTPRPRDMQKSKK